MHILLIGSPGVGKSSVIKRLLDELDYSICGFETKKEDSMWNESDGSPVYIYDVEKEHKQNEENLLGYSKNRHCSPIKETFDRYALFLKKLPWERQAIVMDELGTMESVSDEFCNAVLELLDGETLVIAAVKDKKTAFLDAVRSHKNCKCFYITMDNREDVFYNVIEFIKGSEKNNSGC